MPQNAFIDLFKPSALIVAGALLGITACTIEDASTPTFWEERDEFTEIDGYYLDARVWIDHESGQYLDLQFQCFRHSGAQLSHDQNLLIVSSVESNRPYSSPMYLDAVLFRSEGENAQVYRNDFNGEVLSPFTGATLDLGSLLQLDENDDYRSLHLRFVFGASPLAAQIGDVGALSRAESVDFDLSATNQEAGQFLRACAPVKNWVPPE